MPHVTVPDIVTRQVYVVGATPQREFAIPFSFFSADDIRVFVNGAEAQRVGAPATAQQFSVSGIAVDDGFASGMATLDADVANASVIVEREVAIESARVISPTPRRRSTSARSTRSSTAWWRWRSSSPAGSPTPRRPEPASVAWAVETSGDGASSSAYISDAARSLILENSTSLVEFFFIDFATSKPLFENIERCLACGAVRRNILAHSPEPADNQDRYDDDCRNE